MSLNFSGKEHLRKIVHKLSNPKGKQLKMKITEDT